MRSTKEIQADRDAFEVQFKPAVIPAGTPDRKRLQDEASKAAHAAACLPANIAKRLAFIAEYKKAERSENAKAAAVRRAADPEEQIRQWVFRHLRRMGFKREIRTQSGSTYYRFADLTVRVSDHDVPMTDDRASAVLWGLRTWADNGWSLVVTTGFAAARWLVDVRRCVRRMKG